MIHHNFGIAFVPSMAPPPRVFITVQHDGLSRHVFEGLYENRKSGTEPDSRTLLLAMRLFRAASPHVGVIYSLFPRSVLETNVPPDEAYRDPALKPLYDSYHQEVEGYLAAAVRAHGTCALLDLHGFSSDGQPSYAPPGGYDVILGTGNRSTIPHHEAGTEATDDLDYRIRDALTEAGLAVFCPEWEPILERRWREEAGKYVQSGHEAIPNDMVGEDEESDPRFLIPPRLPDFYNGGYLIRQHASRDVAAIQMEVTYEFRQLRSERTPAGEKKESGLVAALSALIKEIRQ